MEEFRDPTQLANAVRSHGQPRPLIGVDGAHGSGKSTLASALAEQLDGVTLKLDDYTLKNGEPYRLQLRYDDIARDLAALRAQGPVIVDGICLLDVMDKIGVTLDVLCYVKKLNDLDIWPDEDICDPEQINLDSALLKIAGAGVARDVASYHLARDPLSKANFLFVRLISS